LILIEVFSLGTSDEGKEATTIVLFIKTRGGDGGGVDFESGVSESDGGVES
jgi:hypothetical protein